MDTWIHKMIKTRSRNCVLAWGLVLGCSIFSIIVYPYYHGPVYIAVVSVIVVAGLGLFLQCGLPTYRYLQDPSSHPVMRRLASWDKSIGIAVEIEREAESPRIRTGGWMVTDNYLIQLTAFTFNLLRLTDLLWAYKHVTKHKVNFVPAGEAYVAVLMCDGGSAEIGGGEMQVDSVISFASQRAPWAFFGFSEEISNLFSQKPQKFYSFVKERKHECERKAHLQRNA
jgi:hypothetical protein